MRIGRPNRLRSALRLKHAVFVAGLLAGLIVSSFAAPAIAHASGGPTNTRADKFGTPEVLGSAWLTSLGGGVTIYSNGPNPSGPETNISNCVKVPGGTGGQGCGKGTVPSGWKWQCVELVNRLYLTKGWITSWWAGNGFELFGDAPKNLKKESNGAITYLNPGDVVAFSGGKGKLGHVAIVNSVHGSTVQIASQNTRVVFDGSLSLHNGFLSAPGWTGEGYTVQGVIHHPAGPSSALNPNQPAFYANRMVQWDGDTQPQKTAWLVSGDLKRYWIPDSSTFNCLRSSGTAFAGPISVTILNQLPDQTGHSAACGNHALGTNQYLFRGSSLISSNGQYHLELQKSDGNLVLYGSNGTARWSNARSSDYLALQPDGNLVTYSYTSGVAWASNTGNTGASQLVVGNDGTLDLYAPGGILKWSSLFASPPVGSTATSTAAPTRQQTATPTPKSAAPPPTATPAPPPGLGATPGIARQSGTHWEWLLRNSNTGGAANYDFGYAGYNATDIPIAGDWDGNGTVTPGIVRQNGTHWEWLLSNSLTGGAATYDFIYGAIEPGDVPVVGDWDGNGTTTVGIARRNGTHWEWLLRNSNTGGAADDDFIYAGYTSTDRPVVGDWDGNGTTTVGIARQNGTHWEWLLRNSNTGGAATYDFGYAGYYSTDVPVVGDWDGNGTTTIGIARHHGTQWEWLLRNSNSGGIATYDFTYAGYTATDRPVVGNWDGRS